MTFKNASARITITGTITSTSPGNGASGPYTRAIVRADDGTLMWGTLFSLVGNLPGSSIGTRVSFSAVLVPTTSRDLPTLHYTRPTKVTVIGTPPDLPLGTRVVRRGSILPEGGRFEDLYATVALDDAGQLVALSDDGTRHRFHTMWDKCEPAATQEGPHGEPRRRTREEILQTMETIQEATRGTPGIDVDEEIRALRDNPREE